MEEGDEEDLKTVKGYSRRQKCRGCFHSKLSLSFPECGRTLAFSDVVSTKALYTLTKEAQNSSTTPLLLNLFASLSSTRVYGGLGSTAFQGRFEGFLETQHFLKKSQVPFEDSKQHFEFNPTSDSSHLIGRKFGPAFLLKLYLAGPVGGSVFFLVLHAIMIPKKEGEPHTDPSKVRALGFDFKLYTNVLACAHRNDPEAVELCYSDIKCLSPETYLSSTIMNFYIQYLQQQGSLTEGARGSYHFFNTNFYQKLKEAVSRKVILGVGFGISKPEHVKQIAGWGAASVIVGSAAMKILGEAKSLEEGLKPMASL